MVLSDHFQCAFGSVDVAAKRIFFFGSRRLAPFCQNGSLCSCIPHVQAISVDIESMLCSCTTAPTTSHFASEPAPARLYFALRLKTWHRSKQPWIWPASCTRCANCPSEATRAQRDAGWPLCKLRLRDEPQMPALWRRVQRRNRYCAARTGNWARKLWPVIALRRIPLLYWFF
jgi:hypothetical protein